MATRSCRTASAPARREKWDPDLVTRTGRALCIGVDTSESHDALAEADARALADVASRQGFQSATLLLGSTATRDAVRAQLREASSASHPGDLFMLTFSGHGGERGVWVLFDGSLKDAELRECLAAFRPGVRVLVISDACNGGVPIDSPTSDIAASVLVLAACQSHQLADAPGMPAHFTTALLRTPAVTYRELYEKVAAGMPDHQRPNLFWAGASDPDFESERPFSI
jgi:metacaspase-1